MKIFISWSGDKSHKVALVLEEWIPKVIQVVEPWVSSKMSKGIKWDEEIGKNLESINFGIVVLTKENLNSEWIHFESGALSKIKGTSHVCTFLLDIKPSDVKYPLAKFQATQFNKSEVFQLIKTINDNLELNNEKALKEKFLEDTFDTFWPKLEELLNKLIKYISVESKQELRSSQELLEEILQNIRVMMNSNSNKSNYSSDNWLRIKIRGNINNFRRMIKLFEDNDMVMNNCKNHYHENEDTMEGVFLTPIQYNYNFIYNLLKEKKFQLLDMYYLN